MNVFDVNNIFHGRVQLIHEGDILIGGLIDGPVTRVTVSHEHNVRVDEKVIYIPKNKIIPKWLVDSNRFVELPKTTEIGCLITPAVVAMGGGSYFQAKSVWETTTRRTLAYSNLTYSIDLVEARKHFLKCKELYHLLAPSIQSTLLALNRASRPQVFNNKLVEWSSSDPSQMDAYMLRSVAGYIYDTFILQLVGIVSNYQDLLSHLSWLPAYAAGEVDMLTSSFSHVELLWEPFINN